MIIRILSAFILVPATLLICSLAQPSEDRAFGWSLTVDPGAKGKQDRQRSTPAPKHQAIDDSEIRIESSLVLSDVLVLDGSGNPVSGLRESDFEISESGQPQNIDVFASGSSAIPRSIFLVIDHSLSQWRYIDKTIAAAKTLVDNLRPVDRMAIISDDISLVADLTADKELLKNSLEMLRKKSHDGDFGLSRQYSALLAVMNEKIERNGTRNIIIFQTDGDELATLGTGLSKLTFDGLCATAKRKGATIYSVYTGTRFTSDSKKEKIATARKIMQDEAKAFYVLQRKQSSYAGLDPSVDYLLSRVSRLQMEDKAVAEIAIRSGGISQVLESADQADAIYQNILSDIGRRYLIGYYRSDERDMRIGREREVKISLRNKGRFRVVGGRTYVAY